MINHIFMSNSFTFLESIECLLYFGIHITLWINKGLWLVLILCACGDLLQFESHMLGFFRVEARYIFPASATVYLAFGVDNTEF